MKDQAYKRKMRARSLGSFFYLVIISSIMLPVAYIMRFLWRRPKIKSQNFFGMSVNYDKAPQETPELLKELGVQHILVRFHLKDTASLNTFHEWLKRLPVSTITLNLIQSPEMSKQEQIDAFHTVFKTLHDCVKRYQIGTTINRAKWGFFSVREYLKFFRLAYKVAKKNYPDIELIGPSVIDFEYHYTAQALFNFSLIRFNACSALLYTDRTGTPENRQQGFDLIRKIDLLYSLVKLSWKVKNRIIITETNWPIQNSGKYAPTSSKECVDEEQFANYMVRYYLLALASGKVESVYWHQLISVGFGLVNPLDSMRKRSAFYAFQTMIQELSEATDIGFKRYAGYYELTYTNKKHSGSVLWTNDTRISAPFKKEVTLITRDGVQHKQKGLILTGKPVYIIEENYL